LYSLGVLQGPPDIISQQAAQWRYQ
jgi:hypothetical protein